MSSAKAKSSNIAKSRVVAPTPAVNGVYASPMAGRVISQSAAGRPATALRVNPYSISPERTLAILRKAKVITKTGRLTKVFR